ncbi:MAG: hypothetical protein M1831_005410 [Alyxoria varia]|nr:MAG: hypothetical protein M1831_005410 [Alyxoria varia]
MTIKQQNSGPTLNATMSSAHVSTLSKRGAELANIPSLRDKWKPILDNPYDPDKNPDGFIALGVSENYAMLPEIKEYVNKNIKLQANDFSYGEGPWGTRRLRNAMAKFMTKHFGALNPLNPDKLLFSNGVTSICEELAFTIADPGDGVLYSRPIYQAFQMDFGLKGNVKPVFTDFGDVDQFSPGAAVKYEEALLKARSEGIRVRALMLCNPHNPLGQCYPKDTIIALMKLCNKYKIHLLCDEIYAISVYDVPDENAVPFTSVLSFDTSSYISPDYLHVIYGMSKDFAAGGVRMGCIYLENKELLDAMSAISQFHWPGGPSQEIATSILEDGAWLDHFLQLSRERLSERNKQTRRILDDAGIKYHLGSNAGFFLWINLQPYLPRETAGKPIDDGWQREAALSQQFIDNGVYLTEGQGLSSEAPGWFRVIFSQDERVIRAGLERVFKTIDKV